MVLPSFQHPVAVLKKTRAYIARGFTLIEMLVVIGIIVVISGIILAQNTRFGGMVQLQNLAYDIALTVRQAQVYGISVSRFNSSSTFAPAYGMHFQTSSPNSYQLFGDVNTPADGVYNIGCNCELVQSTTIQSGYKILYLFVSNGGTESATGTVTSLDISYRRPDPDACISKNGNVVGFNAFGKCVSNINEQARIVVQSPRGDTKSVIVSLNGQISVQ